MAGNAVPKRQSKETHELHKRGEIVFVSFDIETAGEQVGIIQISAEVFRLDLVQNKNTQGKYKEQINSARDTAMNIHRDPELFNKCINPKSDIEWCPQAMEKNHLYPQHPSIADAYGIAAVWHKFVGCAERKIGHDKTAVLVAWNGKSCDLKWLWRLTQVPGSALSMPDKRVRPREMKRM